MLRHPLARLAACLLTTVWMGCTTAKTVDVLESRLRHQEGMIESYESEMKRVKSELTVTRREAEDLRLQLAESGQATLPAEESGALFRASGIQFSALMTGGIDADGEAGHDGLSVVLIPHDHDGELVKLPGNVEIEAFDLSQPGGATRIGHWLYDQRDIHSYWHKGVIQSGYQFELPWQTPPTSEKVLLVGHLSAANGRRFEATLTVKIDPPTDRFARTGSTNRPDAIEQVSAVSPQSEIIWASGEGPATSRDEPKSAPAHGFTRQTSSPTLGTSPFYRDNDARTNFSQASPVTGSDFSRELNRPSPLSAQPPSPHHDRLQSSEPAAPQRPPSPRPPPLEDWWAEDDWATETSSANRPAVRTSDSFTEETMPQYR